MEHLGGMSEQLYSARYGTPPPLPHPRRPYLKFPPPPPYPPPESRSTGARRRELESSPTLLFHPQEHINAGFHDDLCDGICCAIQPDTRKYPTMLPPPNLHETVSRMSPQLDCAAGGFDFEFAALDPERFYDETCVPTPPPPTRKGPGKGGGKKNRVPKYTEISFEMHEHNPYSYAYCDPGPTSSHIDFPVPGCSRDFPEPGCSRDFSQPGCSREFSQPGCSRDFSQPGCSRDFPQPGCSRDFSQPGCSRDFSPQSYIRDFSQPGCSRDFSPAGCSKDFSQPSCSKDLSRPSSSKDYLRSGCSKDVARPVCNSAPRDRRNKHTYTTRYGTEENIYEEIGDVSLKYGQTSKPDRRRQNKSSMSLNQSLVEEEVRLVQMKHRQVLGELNLSVEAMLMPPVPPGEEEDPALRETVEKPEPLDELLLTVGPTDELLSPASCSLAGDHDSGFSGSSSTSYNSANSLRRFPDGTRSSQSLPRSVTPMSAGGIYTGSSSTCSPLLGRGRKKPLDVNCSKQDSTNSKTKGFWSRKGWKKLGFGSSSTTKGKETTVLFCVLSHIFTWCYQRYR